MSNGLAQTIAIATPVKKDSFIGDRRLSFGEEMERLRSGGIPPCDGYRKPRQEVVRLPVGVFFRFGLYAVRFLAQEPGSGGRLSAVPHRGSVDRLTGSKAAMVQK